MSCSFAIQGQGSFGGEWGEEANGLEKSRGACTSQTGIATSGSIAYLSSSTESSMQ